MLISLNLSNFSVLLGHPHRMRNLSERSRFFSLRNPSFYDIWSQPQSELFRTTVRTLLRTDLLKTSLSTFPSLNQAPIVGQLFRIFLERERLLSAYLTLKKKCCYRNICWSWWYISIFVIKQQKGLDQPRIMVRLCI